VAVFSLVPLIRLDAVRSAIAIAVPALVLVVGILILGPRSPANISNAINLAAMASLALVSSRFLFAERIRDLHQREVIARQQAKLAKLALTDELTGLANRRSLGAGLRRECRRSIREGAPLALIMLDIDHFKQFNDIHGHVAGDECLRRVAACLMRQARRPGDMAARFGGEEFVMLLPGLDLAAARDLAESIRTDILALGLPHPGSPLARLTVSLGVAARLGEDDTPEDLLARADGALYAAKASGRNLVYVAGVPTGATPDEDGQSAADQAG
jgi:diguanylate cyclase (GGDEF)-like protein